MSTLLHIVVPPPDTVLPLPAREDPPPASYDELVRRSPQGCIFAQRWWLDAVAPGAVEIVEIRRGRAVLAAWPLVVCTRDGERHIGMPALSQRLGILFAPSNAKPIEQQSTNQRLAGELIDKLPAFATFRQNFHENFTDWLPFHWRGFAQTTRYTYTLDCRDDLDTLWGAMRPHHRKSIRKAQNRGVHIRDDLPLDRFLELNRKTYARQKLDQPASDGELRRLDEAVCANAARRIFAGVDADGRVHAAVYVAWDNGVAYYLMGGSEPTLRDSGAHVFALWAAICFARTVAARFDFEGSMLPQVERVFRGFGATQRPYFAIAKAPQPPATLREYVEQSVQFRWRRIRRALVAPDPGGATAAATPPPSAIAATASPAIPAARAKPALPEQPEVHP